MYKLIAQTTLIALLLAGCVQLPPTPQDIQAKKFEIVPDKAAVYIVRTSMDSQEVGSLLLDDVASLTTFRGTYYRWEVAPGKHHIAGFGQQSAAITLDVEARKIYFVEHTVFGSPRTGAAFTFLTRINAQKGRALVSDSELLAAF